MNKKPAAIWMITVCCLGLAGLGFAKDVSKSEAEEMGVTWVSRSGRKIGDTIANVIVFTNVNPKQQYTLKFKVSYYGTNSLTDNRSMVSKKEYKVVLNPSSTQEVAVPDAPGFGFSLTPSVTSLSISRTNTKK